ncbi:MAG TPA: NADPH:quinone reductase [bacterium]|jgi:NADPH2:quinone reductase|nr:NADPH:quinone reductase [bacterium]
MKAIVVESFGGPEVLVLKQVPDPKPGPGQVLVQVKAVGVNPYETHIRSGAYPLKPNLPYTPGADAAGVVLAVGPETNRFKAGDRVYTFSFNSGAYAEQLVSIEDNLQFLPSNVSFAQGAALGVPYATAHYSLFQRGQAQAGETVLVHGASGGVGIGAVQLARAAGLTVFGTASTEEGRKVLLKEGAHGAFDHSESGYLDKIVAATGGKGLDIILEMLANVNLDKDLNALSLRGRVIVIGSRGRVEIDPRSTMGRNADIRGLTLFNASPGDRKAIHAHLHAGLENGTLRPIIAEQMPLSDAPRAHEAVMKNKKIGKIVLVP